MPKELTVQERASQALTIEHTEAQLAELAGKSADLKEIKDEADYELVKRSALVLRDVRIHIEKAGKAARDDANAFSKAVIAEERRLTGIITPEEDRLKALRKAVDDEEERKAEELRQREIARIEAITKQIELIQETGRPPAGCDATRIQEYLDQVQAISDFSWAQEYAEQAKDAVGEAVSHLSGALNERKAFEEQLAETQRIAALQAAQQAEMDRERAELDKQAAEIQAQQDRIKAEKEEADRVEREKREAEEAKIREAERKQAEEDRKERERLEEIQRQQIAREASAREAERQKALLPAKEKLIAWAEQIKNMEGPAGIRGKAQQQIVADALAGLGKIGNAIHAAVKNL